jgi:TPR repeat protein
LAELIEIVAVDHENALARNRLDDLLADECKDQVGYFCFAYFVEKLQILETASNRGCPIATHGLALHLIETNEDPKRIYQLFKSAARLGLDASQQNLSKCLADGFGCAIDGKESFKWLLRASASGNADIQARVCTFYRRGVRGVVEKNDKKAFHYGTVSYDRSVAGMFEMGMVWMSKTDTDGSDAIVKAMLCLETAADAGYTMAMLRLGDHYYERAAAE